MANENKVGDEEVQVNGKTFSLSTLNIKFNLKTLIWILGGLYMVLGYLYFDLRKELKNSSSILDKEKKEFVDELEEKFDDKLDDIVNSITEIKVDQATIKGDIKVILDRQNRENPIERNEDVDIQEVTPPSF